MITRRELRQQAMRQGVALGALEKDYILTLVLRQLYAEQTWKKTLVFKGGTALHKLYLGRRLSLDLDFTAQEAIRLEAIRPTLEIPQIEGRIKDAHEFHDALTINRLGFVGPLQHPNSIKIDISFREIVQLPPRQMALSTPYGPPFSVTCMALEEILAEKTRATLMRRAPRDYFDLWWLLRAYEPQKLWAEPDVLQRLWTDDLRQLMHDVPPFDTMFGELRALFEERMPQTL